MGKTKDPEQILRHCLTVRLNDDDYNVLRKFIKKEKVTFSSFLRFLLTNGLTRNMFKVIEKLNMDKTV